MSCSIVYIVHCVDTEGPLYEFLYALWERVNAAFELALEPSELTLSKLQNQQLETIGDERMRAEVVLMVAP